MALEDSMWQKISLWPPLENTVCHTHIQMEFTGVCRSFLVLLFYWLPFPPSGALPDPVIKPIPLKSPASAGGFFATPTTWEAPWHRKLYPVTLQWPEWEGNPKIEGTYAYTVKDSFLCIISFIYLFGCAGSLLLLGLSLGVGYASCSAWSPHCGGLLSLQSTGSKIVVHELSCSEPRGIFPDQGSNLCLLHWQADFLPVSQRGRPVQDSWWN